MLEKYRKRISKKALEYQIRIVLKYLIVKIKIVPH